MRRKINLELSYRERNLLLLIDPNNQNDEKKLEHDRHSLSFNLKRDLDKLKPGDLLVYWWDINDSHLRILDEWDIKYLLKDNVLYGEYLKGDEISLEEREELRKNKTKWWSLSNLGHATYADIVNEKRNQYKIYRFKIFDIIKSEKLVEKSSMTNTILKSVDHKSLKGILNASLLYRDNLDLLYKLKIGKRAFKDALIKYDVDSKGNYIFSNDKIIGKIIKLNKTYNLNSKIIKSKSNKSFKDLKLAINYFKKELIEQGYYPAF